MKGTKIYRVLKMLEGGAKTIGDFVDGMQDIPLRRGTSIRKAVDDAFLYHLGREGRAAEREKRYEKYREEFRRRQRVYEYVSRLKNQGLILERKEKGKKVFNLSRRGIFKLEKLANRPMIDFPDPRRYGKESDHKVKIATFDIPEKVAHKRIWLRAALHHLGFEKLQQSVWLGKAVIPEEFLRDLVELGLSEYVEIFSVEKAGSLRQVL